MDRGVRTAKQVQTNNLARFYWASETSAAPGPSHVR